MLFLTQTVSPTQTPIISGEQIAKDLTALEQFMKDVFWPNLYLFLIKLAIAIVVYYIGTKIIKLVMKLLRRFFEKSSLDEGASYFLHTVIRIVLYIILIIIAGGFVGVETSSVVALIGSAGLTIGLALQGSLSNFAGGVLILVLKPFKVGDYIITGTNEGTVSKIDIFCTRLLTVDNRMVVLPNGTLSNSNITNVTNEPERRLDLVVPVAYSADIDQVRTVLQGVADSCELVLKDHDIDIFLMTFDASSINMAFRVWVQTENYWKLKFEMQEKIKKSFDQANISIPFNQLDVNIINNEVK